ncbi:MAG: ABC transporter ATP-binding protein [Clostridia bacterium]|nr:ABC transporter ATP-binding protein [Clostridia bacterium]
MLTVQHVTKKYGKTIACDDVTFTIEDGTTSILLGPNGAGKSTILKSIAGLIKHDGAILVGGFGNKTTEARRILGYIPEIPALYPNLTVEEHMEFIARAYGMTDYAQKINNLLERFELSDKKKKFGDQLSKGMQQKLNICLGLLTDPQVILMDEPMIGLDPHAIKELKTVIDELRNQGKTLFISTHIIDSVDMLWDRTIIMQGGKVMADVARDELSSRGTSLEDYFFEVTEGVESHLMRGTPEV